MTEQVTQGDLYSLLQEINIIYQTNAIIPAKLDVACSYVKQHNKKSVFNLQDKIKEINDRHIDKDDNGTYKTKEVKQGEGVITQMDARDPAAHEKDIQELMMQPVQIKVLKIHPNDLGQIVFNRNVSQFEVFKKIMVNGLEG